MEAVRFYADVSQRERRVIFLADEFQIRLKLTGEASGVRLASRQGGER